MKQFPLFDENTAPIPSRPLLEETKKTFKMIPNLERTMAGSPPLLSAYVSAWALFSETSLTEIEQQIVYQTVNFENECDYCVPWHTYLSKSVGMEQDDVDALRAGSRLSGERYEALRLFTQALVRLNGNIAQADLDAFFEAGFSPQQALDVVLGISIKVMSNYTNSIAGTPLDDVVKAYEWRKPKIELRS